MTTGTEPQNPPLSQRQLILATDLDGTFLGGDDIGRRRLYRWIEHNRATVGLIFVTGRDPGFITGMVRNSGVPRPDFAVGDVGTTIAEVAADATLHPIEELEREIAERWNDRGAGVREALADHPGLAVQPTDFRYRVSFDMDADSFEERSSKTIVEMGFDPLISDNRFFDVLPRGISKGPSLLRLIEWLGVPKDRVLTAGDTLNDLSMLTCGLQGVAVGGSEPALIDEVRDLAHVFKAQAIGAAGITEAIEALALHPQGKEAIHGV